MGGGGGSSDPCQRGGSGGTNNSNKPQPPRTPGKYRTKSLNPVVGPDVRDTGCPNCGGGNNCNGDEYTWGSDRCSDGASLHSGKAFCVNKNPFVDACPVTTDRKPIGTVTQTDWDGHNVVCQYSSVSAPLSALLTYFDQNTVNLIMTDKCGALGYQDLLGNSECRTFYGTDFNNQLLNRISKIAGWSANQPLAAFVNNTMRGGSGIGAADQATATNLVQTNCDANPKDPMCGCYNVTKYGNACLSDSSKTTLPGCAGLVKEFASLPAGATVGTMSMFCASNECSNALNGDSSLLPGTNPKPCQVNIAQCVNDFSNAHLNGSPVSANCNNAINNVSTAPPPPPSGGATGGGTTGGGTTGGGTTNDKTTSVAQSSSPNTTYAIGGISFCFLLLILIMIMAFFAMK